MKATTPTGEMSANLHRSTLRDLDVDSAIRYAVHVAAVDEHGQRLEPKQVADRMGVTPKALYELTSRRPPRARELDDVVLATRCFLPLDIIESTVGRVAWRVPIIDADGDSAAKRAADACHAFGQLMSEYGENGSDGQWSPRDVSEVRLCVERLCAAGWELVAELEERQLPYEVRR